eukprot:Nk52_evm13s150 gene=Nk52_evmTU13s150
MSSLLKTQISLSNGSLSSGITGDSSFVQALKDNFITRTGIVKVDIQSEKFTLADSTPAGEQIQGNLTKGKALLSPSEPCYLLVPFNGASSSSPKDCCVVTWIPEGKLSVKDRMLYSSSAGCLKNLLSGPGGGGGSSASLGRSLVRIKHEIHAGEMGDLTYVDPDSIDRNQLLSEREKMLQSAHAMEEMARKQQMHSNSSPVMQRYNKQLSNNDRHSNSAQFGVGGEFQVQRGGANSHAGGGSSLLERNGSNVTVQGIGGYHGVAVKLNAGSGPVVERLRGEVREGSTNWVGFRMPSATVGEVEGAYGSVIECYECEPGCVQNDADLAKAMDKDEPRFYLYARRDGTAGAGNDRWGFVFVYSCPEDSPRKMRMVYATAKASVKEIIEKEFVLPIAGQGSIGGGAEAPMTKIEVFDDAVTIVSLREEAKKAEKVGKKPFSPSSSSTAASGFRSAPGGGRFGASMGPTPVNAGVNSSSSAGAGSESMSTTEGMSVADRRKMFER